MGQGALLVEFAAPDLVRAQFPEAHQGQALALQRAQILKGTAQGPREKWPPRPSFSRGHQG